MCLPKKLAAPLGLTPGAYAQVSLSPVHDGELVVTAAEAPKRQRRTHDPRRPRRLTALAQLSLPAALLSEVGVTKDEPWVYFAPTDDNRAVRVIPAALVNAQVNSRLATEVMT